MQTSKAGNIVARKASRLHCPANRGVQWRKYYYISEWGKRENTGNL